MLLLIEAPAGYVQECHAGPVRRLLVRMRASSLDQTLAGGASPDSSVLLTLRAGELLGRPRRLALAESIFELLEQSLGSATGAAAGVVDWAGVRRARWELAELAATLGAPGAVSVRGVALAQRLLTDGAGPLCYPDTLDHLSRAARAATRELDPWRSVED